jgi:hypothetical protein
MWCLKSLEGAMPDIPLRETRTENGQPYPQDSKAPHIFPAFRWHSLGQSSSCRGHRIHARLVHRLTDSV